MSLILPSGRRINTPAFIASLSSVANPRWLHLAKALRNGIASQGLVLVSAKDVAEERIRKLDGFAGIVLDSGGYESRRQRRAWSPRLYQDTCARFRADIVVGFDADKGDPPSLPEQIQRQVSAFKKVKPSLLRVLLLHVDPRDANIRVLSDALQAVSAEWDVLGIVERDLGETLADRLHGVRLIRDMLDTTALYRPLHVFGAGDPFAIALYALAGADLFDALNWCTGFLDADTLQVLPFEAHDFSDRWHEFARSRGGPTSDAVRRGLVCEWNLQELARLCTSLQKAILDPSDPRHLGFLAARAADLRRIKHVLGEDQVDTVLQALRANQ